MINNTIQISELGLIHISSEIIQYDSLKKIFKSLYDKMYTYIYLLIFRDKYIPLYA